MVSTAILTVARRVYWLCGQPCPDTQRAEPFREAQLFLATLCCADL
jgi:hypothetical protein